MKYPENIAGLVRLPVDYMGMIFYRGSARYMGDVPPGELPSGVKRVGVFVDAGIDFVEEKTREYSLDLLQLHGGESPEYCAEIKAQLGLPVIKAFGISERRDFVRTVDYEKSCDYFLFDTKTPTHGGSGHKFDWGILDSYRGRVPFFLSGGIAPDDWNEIKNLRYEGLYAVDINSRFELTAGLKNMELVEKFIKNIKNEQNKTAF